MEDLNCIVYVSSAIRPLAVPELEALLVSARQFNDEVGVTGVLLYHDGTFFQYFEGPAEGVAQVYARIRASRSHHAIYELLNTKIKARLFPNWLMGASNVTSSLLLNLARAEWHASIQQVVDLPEVPNEGLALLTSYWKSCGYGP